MTILFSRTDAYVTKSLSPLQEIHSTANNNTVAFIIGQFDAQAEKPAAANRKQALQTCRSPTFQSVDFLLQFRYGSLGLCGTVLSL